MGAQASEVASQNVLQQMLGQPPANDSLAPITDEQQQQLDELMAGVADYRRYRRRTQDLLERRLHVDLSAAPARRTLQLRGVAAQGRGRFALSEQEIESFAHTGLTLPFPVLCPQEAQELRDYVLRRQAEDFDGNTVFSDEIRSALKQHGAWGLNAAGLYQALFDRRLWDLHCRPEIVDRLQCLLGGDLLCWRSQMFEAPAGSEGTFWHQASRFRELSDRPKLQSTSAVDEAMIQLTAWVALEDVGPQNACLRFLEGSFCDDRLERFMYRMFDHLIDHVHNLPPEEQRRVLRLMLFQTSIFKKAQVAFHEAVRLQPDLFDAYRVVDREMQAGECILFTSLNVHASFPNSTPRARLALAGRYTTNDVRVLNGVDQEPVSTPAGVMSWPLDRVASIQVSGEDRYGFNRIATPPA